MGRSPLIVEAFPAMLIRVLWRRHVWMHNEGSYVCLPTRSWRLFERGVATQIGRAASFGAKHESLPQGLLVSATQGEAAFESIALHVRRSWLSLEDSVLFAIGGPLFVSIACIKQTQAPFRTRFRTTCTARDIVALVVVSGSLTHPPSTVRRPSQPLAFPKTCD
jgi:hypothetical protein